MMATQFQHFNQSNAVPVKFTLSVQNLSESLQRPLAKVGYLTILDGMIKHGTSIGERWYMQALSFSQENQ
jgi:hypothetical protein